MYNKPEQIAEQYELELKSVSKGRETYIWDTNQGIKTLREYRGSAERGNFLKEMLEYLGNQGLCVEQICETTSKTAVAVLNDGTKYILLDVPQGEECDTRKEEEMLAAVGQLACLHQSANSYSGQIPEFLKANTNDLWLLYEKHNRELNKVKNYIYNKRKKNDFEVMFAQHYTHFIAMAKESASKLAELSGEKTTVGFCHGEFNQHNVIFSKGKTAIIHFDNFSYNLQIGDLANFIRKMMEKNNWNGALGMKLIEAYYKKRKMSVQELQFLYLYLAYPEKFWKIANRYFNTHKAWLSGRNIEKLEKVIAQESERENFLQILREFIKNT